MKNQECVTALLTCPGQVLSSIDLQQGEQQLRQERGILLCHMLVQGLQDGGELIRGVGPGPQLRQGGEQHALPPGRRRGHRQRHCQHGGGSAVEAMLKELCLWGVRVVGEGKVSVSFFLRQRGNTPPPGPQRTRRGGKRERETSAHPQTRMHSKPTQGKKEEKEKEDEDEEERQETRKEKKEEKEKEKEKRDEDNQDLIAHRYTAQGTHKVHKP